MTWILCKAIDGKTWVPINTHWVQSIVCSHNAVITFHNGMRETVHSDNMDHILAALKLQKPVAKPTRRK